MLKSAIFCVPFVGGSPALPPMESFDGRLALGAGEGSGWCCIGHIPQTTTCLVRVTTSQAVLDAMKASDEYLWIEDC